MGEYGAYRRDGSAHVPKDLATHNASVGYWIYSVALIFPIKLPKENKVCCTMLNRINNRTDE